MKVTRSGYYAWKAKAQIGKTKDELVEKVKEIFSNSRKTYGSRKIKAQLNKQGVKVSRKKIQKIMQDENLKPITVRKYKATTNSKHNFAVAENLIKDIKAERINQI